MMDFLGGELPVSALLEDPLLHLPDVPEYSSLRIPPLQDPVPFHAHSRPSPLEPSAGSDREAQNTKAKLSGQSGVQKQGRATTESGATLPLGYDGNSASLNRSTNQQLPKTALPLTISLRVLEKKGNESMDQDGPRKRARIDDTEKTSDFVKLPKPRARAQKEQQMLPTFGPFTVLNGLVEPPPNAALLPPIEPDFPLLSEAVAVVDEREQDNARKSDAADGQKEPQKDHTSSEESKKGRTRRKFCKWSKDETNDLLKGVAKHGIGNWKLILEDSEFKFHDRKPTDLKDRFRVCCPNAYSNKVSTKDTSVSAESNMTGKSSAHKDSKRPKQSTSAIHTSNILLPQSPSPTSSHPTTADAAPAPSKSKAHALPQSALNDLGITKFAPSARRLRRPFTKEEDDNLLRGIQAYGFAWSTIQKENDSFSLGHRRSTDLRDRIRNKYPDWYAGIADGPFSEEPENPGVKTGAKHGTSKTKGGSGMAVRTRTSEARARMKSRTGKKSNAIDKGASATSGANTSGFFPSERSLSKAATAAAEPSIFHPSLPSLAESLTDQLHLSMPTLTMPLNVNPNLTLGTGSNLVTSMPSNYELPAISTAIGETSHFGHLVHMLDESNTAPGNGTVPGVAELEAGMDEELEWDNTLPRLLAWDDMGVWKEN